MRDEKNLNLDAFVKGWSAWTSAAPKALIDEDPTHIIRILQLCDTDAGVSHSAVIEELHIPQSKLSKLVKKLEDLRWIHVQPSASDGRVKLPTTARAGREWLRGFETLASGLSGGRRSRRQTVTPEADNRQGFEFDGCFEDDTQPEIR